jgi:hypothetical protein
MVKKVSTAKKVVEAEQEEVVQEQPKSNVKKLVKKEAPAPKEEVKTKKEKAAPKEVDPNQVSLKELCDEHGLNPTTARVKLRRKFGAQGQRYSWEKDSKELEEVLAILIKEEKEPAEKKAPAAKKKTKAAAAPEPEESDEEGEEEGEEEEVEDAELE